MFHSNIIYSLWDRGLENAPDLVCDVVSSWRKYAPDYEIRMLDESDLTSHMEELHLDHLSLPIQAASDVLRVKLLSDTGGVWLDATTLLSAPLTGWLDEAVLHSGFFAPTRPGPDRLIASWCMACEQDNPLPRAFLPNILSYWDRKRRVYHGYEGISRWNISGRRERTRVLKDPARAIDPEFGANSPYAPYYWLHYNFERGCERDTGMKKVWDRTLRISALPALALEAAVRAGDFACLTEGSIQSMLQASPIHKLNWRIPREEYVRILTAIEAREV